MKAPILLIIFALSLTPVFAQENVTEVFRVGNIGVPNAAEKSDKLLELFGAIKKEYDTTIGSKVSQQFKGPRVRVIKVLDQSANLYMIGYGGKPSVAEIETAQPLKPGQLTPPLVITEAGEHVTEYQKKVAIAPKPGSKPQLEKVTKGGTASFFGIPIGGGSAQSEPEPEEQVTYKFVTEKKTLQKYSAVLSTEKLDNRPTSFTRQMFLTQIKNGEVFEVTRDEVRRCLECNGFRRVIPKIKPSGSVDGKIACPECREVGTVDYTVTYNVTW